MIADDDIDYNEALRIYECPWCLCDNQTVEHIRRCSNYKPAYTG